MNWMKLHHWMASTCSFLDRVIFHTVLVYQDSLIILKLTESEH